jgi:hypothetical protein
VLSLPLPVKRRSSVNTAMLLSKRPPSFSIFFIGKADDRAGAAPHPRTGTLDPRPVLNPVFETAYFRRGFREANVWIAA